MIKRNYITIYLFLLFVVGPAMNLHAQSYDFERVELANYVKRLYENAPFEGVRLLNTYKETYLLSALSLDVSNYKNSAQLNRVAETKAMAEASRFFNGSKITIDEVIGDNSVRKKVLQSINEHSTGYVKSLSYLTSFPISEERTLFVSYTLVK